jgi:hypothetical protein
MSNEVTSKLTPTIAWIDSKLPILISFFNLCYNLLSIAPIVSGILALAFFIFSCINAIKLKNL